MFDSIISELDDRSANGIVAAIERGEVPEGSKDSRIASDARALVEEGRGDWRYIGSLGELPQWEPPTGENLAEKPPPEAGETGEPETL